MPPNRSVVLNLRIEPGLKDALRVAAEREHRSLANMVEWLIRRHCEHAGITIPRQSLLSLDTEDEDGSRHG